MSFDLLQLLEGRLPALYHLKYDSEYGLTILLHREAQSIIADDSSGKFRQEDIDPMRFIQRNSVLDEQNYFAYSLNIEPVMSRRGRLLRDRLSYPTFLSTLFFVLEWEIHKDGWGHEDTTRANSQHLLLSAGNREGMSECFIAGYVSFPLRDWLLNGEYREYEPAVSAMMKIGQRLGEKGRCGSAKIGSRDEGRGGGLLLSAGGSLSGSCLGLTVVHSGRYELDPGNMNNCVTQLVILAGLASIYTEFRSSF